jgi:uncharacterized membrane protein YbhN (UPF0104 family)
MIKAPYHVTPALLVLGKLAITILILWFLWRIADGSKALESIGSAQPVWVMAGLLALTLQTVLSAVRWRITAGQLGLDLSLLYSLREYYLSQLTNQVLPGGVLGDAARAVRTRDQRGLAAAGQAVIFERLAGQIALFVTMCVAVAITYLRRGGLDWPMWTLSPILLVIAIGVAAPILFAVATSLPAPVGPRCSDLARKMGHALAARRVLPAQIGLSIATTLCNLFAFAFCARAVGIILSPAIIFAIVPLILLTMLIPVTISGWGLREGAAVALLPLMGASASVSLAASVTFGLTVLVASLPGLFIIWHNRKPIGTNV